jgi:hypothetical protein
LKRNQTQEEEHVHSPNPNRVEEEDVSRPKRIQTKDDNSLRRSKRQRFHQPLVHRQTLQTVAEDVLQMINTLVTDTIDDLGADFGPKLVRAFAKRIEKGTHDLGVLDR